MVRGGKRPGAGRKPGGKNQATLEKEAVQAAFNQRVMQHADNLFNAQLKLAVGSQRVFRIDVNKKGEVKHTLVTDSEEIKSLLDEYEGSDGEVDGSYYYFQTIIPDNRALDSLLNRTLGRAKESVEHSGEVTVVTRVIKPV
jgi:hypothetical protein